jgi:hypothetical protein
MAWKCATVGKGKETQSQTRNSPMTVEVPHFEYLSQLYEESKKADDPIQ